VRLGVPVKALGYHSDFLSQKAMSQDSKHRENKGGGEEKTYKVEIKRSLLKPRNSEMKEYLGLSWETH
jgi:hypothetical protein